jgi:hypothetical protein
MKKLIPVKKERPKADFRFLSFMDKNKGTRAIQARNSKSNVGNERIRISAEERAKRISIPLMIVVY